MTLKEQITEDMKTAMRAKDVERLGTVRLLLAAIKQKEVDERITVDDAATVAIVDKLLKEHGVTRGSFVRSEDLLDALKSKWDAVNAKYQVQAHKKVSTSTSSLGEIRAKESGEAMMRALEADIRKLSVAGPIFVIQ